MADKEDLLKLDESEILAALDIEEAPPEEGQEEQQAAEAEPEVDAKEEEQQAAGEKAEADTADSQDDGKDRVKTVPHQALHAEREEHKKTRAELSELKETLARFNERLSTVQSQQLQQQPQDQSADKDPEPNRDTDPLGHSEWKARQLEQQIEDLQGKITNVDQQTAHDRSFAAYAQQLAQDAQSIDGFGDAAAHLTNLYTDTLIQQGVPRDQVSAHLRAKEVEIANMAYSIGMRPADLLFTIAQQNGYIPKEVDKSDDQSNGAANGNGSAKETVEKLASDMEANQTLTGKGGTGGGATTVADLANMSEEEFIAFSQKNPELVNSLMGG